MGFLGALGLLFIALKLLEIITWSWWLVLMPLYIIPVLVLAIATLGVTAAVKNSK